MNDEELDHAVRATSPLQEAAFATFDFGSADIDLLEEIMATPILSEELAPALSSGAPHHRRRWLGAAIAAAACVAVVSFGLTGGTGTAYAADVVKIAQANDRLLIDGWKVTRVDEFTADSGEMTFSDGGHQIELHWRTSESYESFVADRTKDNVATSFTLFDRPATLVQYAGTTDFTALAEPTGANFVEIRGDLGSEAAFRAALAKVHSVGVNAWLDALPARAVQPAARAKAIDEMLRGVPRPAGLDVAALSSTTGVSDRYQLGAHVAGAVACGWFDQWFDASERGDTAGVRTASTALVSSHDWAVLRDMDAEGDYPEVLWQLADATRADRPAPTGKQALTRESVAAALGCE